MDRPRSTCKSLPFSPGTPSGVPTPLSIPGPLGARRSHHTPTNAMLDGELSLSRIDRLSPSHQRTPTAMEAGTPRLVAAVSEAKRSGASAPSPSYTDVPMDQFDRLLAKNIRFGTPNATSSSHNAAALQGSALTFNSLSHTPPATHPYHGASRDEATCSSPMGVSKAVHNVVSDEGKRRELLLGLQRLFGDVKVTGHQSGVISRGSNSRNPTPPAQQEALLHSLTTIAKAAREVSPLNNGGGGGGVAGFGGGDNLHHPAPYNYDHSPSAFTHAPKVGICRPRPTERTLEASRQFAEGLAMRQVPTSQKVLKSEMSAFSETTEGSSLTSYSTSKSAKAARQAAGNLAF